MNAKTWVGVALLVVGIAAAVAGIVQWSAKKQSAAAAREVANGAPPMSATVETPAVATTIVPTTSVPTTSLPAPVATVVDPEQRQQAAEALDASAREMREDTIEVQKRLRAEEAARREAAEAPSKEGERCINGQKMKRVQNGWVQAGQC